MTPQKEKKNPLNIHIQELSQRKYYKSDSVNWDQGFRPFFFGGKQKKMN